MSFSSLPPELVHQIVESAVPHTFHTATYQQRQRTLCSLSLVSRLFKSIAQPLLFEIVKLETTDYARKLPASHSFRGNARQNGEVRSLVIEWDDLESEAGTPEEGQLAEYLRLLASARKLTTSYLVPLDFTNWFSTISQHLTHLQLSHCPCKEVNPIHLPHLRDLTLYDVSFEILVAFVDPTAVPNLRNFAFVDPLAASATCLMGSRFNLLLPQLETLGFSAAVWAHPLAAFIHSAVSRTLVDFYVNDSRRLRNSQLPLVHVRLQVLYSQHASYGGNRVQAQLDHWTALIQANPSLALQSIYLDSSLKPSETTPAAIRTSLEALTRICEQRKIDLIFEPFRSDRSLDAYISSEFVSRQQEQRKRERKAEGRGEQN
ncbi:hypothetical protein JCM5350_002322 [Sporobolomyces pararoseus]